MKKNDIFSIAGSNFPVTPYKDLELVRFCNNNRKPFFSFKAKLRLANPKEDVQICIFIP